MLDPGSGDLFTQESGSFVRGNECVVGADFAATGRGGNGLTEVLLGIDSDNLTGGGGAGAIDGDFLSAFAGDGFDAN